MLVRHYFPFRDVLVKNWKIFCLTGLYASFITYIHTETPVNVQQLLELPAYVPAVLGTSLAFFLGFITNSAYDRWWEARKKWGGIVNESRNYAREILSFVDHHDDATRLLVHKMIYRQIAWCYTLKHQLRRQDAAPSLQRILGEKETLCLGRWKNKATGINCLQAEGLQQLENDGKLNTFQAIQIDATMNRLVDHMGACERIKNTVFPTQYHFFVHEFIIFFLMLVPHGAVANMHWFSVLLTLAIAFVYVMIETIEASMNNPFDMKPSDTPMSAICRTIEIDLMQMIDAKKIPQAVIPVDGILD